MKKEKKAKRIDFRVQLTGEGIVNYDSKDQKWIFNNHKTETTPVHRLSCKFDNVSYAKKNFYIDDNGELTYKIKLSNGFLANEMFNEDCVAQHPNILMQHEHLLYHYLASPSSIIRGYLFPIEHSNSINRKSAFSLPEVEQTCNAISYLETCSRSGQKGQSDKTDNTFFKKETVGKIKYAGEGSINLAEMQFVSCDQQYDRVSFNSDMFEIYSRNLGMKMPNFNSKLGYYQLQTSCILVPEYGFKFSNENMIFLVKEMLEKVYGIRVFKRSGSVEVEKLQYKIIYDAIEDAENREENWVTINSLKDIENITFEMEDFYTLQDESKVKQMFKEIEENKQKIKENNELINLEKTASKAEKKNKKESQKSKSEV